MDREKTDFHVLDGDDGQAGRRAWAVELQRRKKAKKDHNRRASASRVSVLHPETGEIVEGEADAAKRPTSTAGRLLRTARNLERRAEELEAAWTLLQQTRQFLADWMDDWGETVV